MSLFVVVFFIPLIFDEYLQCHDQSPSIHFSQMVAAEW